MRYKARQRVEIYMPDQNNVERWHTARVYRVDEATNVVTLTPDGTDRLIAIDEDNDKLRTFFEAKHLTPAEKDLVISALSYVIEVPCLEFLETLTDVQTARLESALSKLRGKH